MNDELLATKILYVGEDEAFFQIWQCMARVVEALPPVELFYAPDASEGLSMLENLKPDVVLLQFDGSSEEERMFLESLYGNHPPVLVPGKEQEVAEGYSSLDSQIYYVSQTDSLEGICEALKTAATVAAETCPDSSVVIH